MTEMKLNGSVIIVIITLAILITAVSVRKMVGWVVLLGSLCFFVVQADPDLPSKIPGLMKRSSDAIQHHLYPTVESVFTRLIRGRSGDDS